MPWNGSEMLRIVSISPLSDLGVPWSGSEVLCSGSELNRTNQIIFSGCSYPCVFGVFQRCYVVVQKYPGVVHKYA